MTDYSFLTRKNFQPEDFFASEKAVKLRIDNHTTNPIILKNLAVVADKIQQIRDLLGKPIKVDSAYRCLEVNRAVESEDTSQHLKGQAIDFICPDFGTPADIFQFLQDNNVEVDQCLMEGTWIHVSIKSDLNRNEFAKLINGVFTKVN